VGRVLLPEMAAQPYPVSPGKKVSVLHTGSRGEGGSRCDRGGEGWGGEGRGKRRKRREEEGREGRSTMQLHLNWLGAVK
jgi:hypothetical protein